MNKSGILRICVFILAGCAVASLGGSLSTWLYWAVMIAMAINGLIGRT